MLSFKDFTIQENLDFLKDQEHATNQLKKLPISESVDDIQTLFKSVKLTELSPNKEGQRYKLDLTTEKGTELTFEIGISELMSYNFVRTLTRISLT